MWIWIRMKRVKWTDRIRNEAVLERVDEERMTLKMIRKRKGNQLDHWLRRNCLLKDALEGKFKVCHGLVYAVMWLADEPREFNLPTLPQRCITYEVEKLPSKYGVLSEEYVPKRTLFSTFCVNVKMQYTLNQRLFLVKQYWITNSITATQRAYQREYGVRNPPKRNTILGLVNKLETTGSLVSEKGKHRSSRLPTVVVDVRARLEQSPKKSLRHVHCAKSYHIVHNMLHLVPSIPLFDDRIISRNLWPPRSPDLTTPDNICYRGVDGTHCVLDEKTAS
ncbi:hypothetical protein ANN_23328 [Periplaneta americana]|uniref:DUF4817 domain-containing protein n=1 Tax=Periplaneta americana TaxID=6978 RepID=A0ABQ8SKS9_PERAM|nr:hypothetical protein ANN_23328 [Periplaneta americana]